MYKEACANGIGTGLAPFLPPPPQPSALPFVLRCLLFAIRLPLLVAACVLYFGLLAWLPIGAIARKAALWTILLVAGVYWVDLQIDGVKRG